MTAADYYLQSMAKPFEQVEQIIKTSSKTFYFATHFLPLQERRAVRSLYAF